MRSPVSLKQEFLKKWLTGLEVCNSSDKNMNIVERKEAIKLSANIAMASARHGTTRWSRALVANACANDNRVLVDQILGPQDLQKVQSASTKISNKRIRCKKILKRSRKVMQRVQKSLRQSRSNHVVAANSIAKRLVKKRTQLLKSLLPGGENMDEVSLIEEALDYIASLRAQVDVMRCIATASDLVNHN